VRFSSECKKSEREAIEGFYYDCLESAWGAYKTVDHDLMTDALVS